MDSETLKQLVVDALDDMKAQDVQCLDVQDLTSVADYMVVATGTSNRHVKAIADEVIDKLKEAGDRPRGVEGVDQSEWILLDLGDVIVHVMQAATRKLYDLESLWNMAPAGRGE